MNKKIQNIAAKPKWQTFKLMVQKYIRENNGIASMAEIHEISTSIFKYSPWSTSNLETLSQFLITHGECFRIDLAVPHKTPLQIYPGHHKVSSTTFFVNEKSEDGHVSDVEKAKNFLNDLTQAAIITSRNKKRKSKPKNAQNENHEDDTNQNNNNISNTKNVINNNDSDTSKKVKELINQENENSSKYRVNQFRARDCMTNGFIPMKRVQIQIMHLFIFETFGSRYFTIQDFIDHMSFDLYSKIVGVKNIPDPILLEPKLRHILIRCFPDQILEKLQFSEAFDILLQNFKMMNGVFKNNNFYLLSKISGKELILKIRKNYSNLKSNDNNFLIDDYILNGNKYNIHEISSNDDYYQLVDSMKVSFFSKFMLSFNFARSYQINEFHFMFSIIDLMENIDPHSYTRWLKRYSFSLQLRSHPTNLTKSIIRKTLYFPFENGFPFYFYQIENFIKEQGQNWANLQATLIDLYKTDGNEYYISKYQKPKDEKIMRFLYDFVSGKDSFSDFTRHSALQQTDLVNFFYTQLIRNQSQNLENNACVNDSDPYLVFNLLTSLSHVLPSCFISEINVDWVKILEYFEKFSKVPKLEFLKNTPPNNLHRILKRDYRDYHDLNDYIKSVASAKLKKFHHFIDCDSSNLKLVYQMSMSQYLKRFNLKQMKYLLPIVISEYIERLKIVSLSPKEYITMSNIQTFLSEIDNSPISEAILFLKLSKFVKHTTMTNSEFFVYHPCSLYSDIAKFFELSKDPENNYGAYESNKGVCTYFLDPEASLSLDFEAKLDSSLNVSALLNIDQNSLTKYARKNKIGGVCKVKVNYIGLPNLPDCEINSGFDSEDVYINTCENVHCNFLSYNSDVSKDIHEQFMQIYIIIYQLRTRKDPQEMALISRLLYSFILEHFTDFIPLSKILNFFASFEIVDIFMSLSILEQYDFIYPLNATTAMPHFISNLYIENRLIKRKIEKKKILLVKPHLWISADGEQDDELLSLLLRKITEIVNLVNGIEFTEIASKLPSLTLHDLYLLLDALEFDEVLYSVYVVDTEASLFENESNVLSPPIDSTMFMYNLSNSFYCPAIKPAKRYIYPTIRSNINLSFVI